MKTALLLAPAALLALAGCSKNGASVQVQAICYPPDACTFSNKCEKVLLGNPFVDVALGDQSIGLFIQVENQLTDNGDADSFRTNTNDAHVDELVLEYSGVAIPRQSFRTNQAVPAGATQIVGVPAVPTGYTGALGAVVGGGGVATLRMRGYFDDGTRFETAEFPIAFDVCAGCVTPCAAGKSVCGGNDGQEPKTCFDPDGAGST